MTRTTLRPRDGRSAGLGGEHRRCGTAARLSWLALAVAASVLPALGLGCSPGDRSLDAMELARRDVDRRLGGRWRLVDFRPETPLQPALETLLAFQRGRLVVAFEGGRVKTELPELTVDDAYRIDKPEGEKFQLTITDPQGVSYLGDCRFDATGQLLFQSWSEPWIGSGVLQRMAE